MLSHSQNSLQYFGPIQIVQRYIRDHIDEPLNREVLAAVAGFSVSHFHSAARLLEKG